MVGENNHAEMFEIAGKKVTFFPASAIGYVDYPEALFVRGLASGFAAAGAEVRVVEERRNQAVEATLQAEGAAAMRRIHEWFPNLAIHSYEARAGAPLLEWISRELALIDIAVAVDGLPDELCRWIANLNHQTLTRVFISYRPERMTAARAAELDIDRFDIVASTSDLAGIETTFSIAPSVAEEDGDLVDRLPEGWQDQLVDIASATRRLLELVEASRGRR